MSNPRVDPREWALQRRERIQRARKLREERERQKHEKEEEEQAIEAPNPEQFDGGYDDQDEYGYQHKHESHESHGHEYSAGGRDGDYEDGYAYEERNSGGYDRKHNRNRPEPESNLDSQQMLVSSHDLAKIVLKMMLDESPSLIAVANRHMVSLMSAHFSSKGVHSPSVAADANEIQEKVQGRRVGALEKLRARGKASSSSKTSKRRGYGHGYEEEEDDGPAPFVVPMPEDRDGNGNDDYVDDAGNGIDPNEMFSQGLREHRGKPVSGKPKGRGQTGGGGGGRQRKNVSSNSKPEWAGPLDDEMGMGRSDDIDVDEAEVRTGMSQMRLINKRRGEKEKDTTRVRGRNDNRDGNGNGGMYASSAAPAKPKSKLADRRQIPQHQHQRQPRRQDDYGYDDNEYADESKAEAKAGVEAERQQPQFVDCEFCGRKFTTERISKHESVCPKARSRGSRKSKLPTKTKPTSTASEREPIRGRKPAQRETQPQTQNSSFSAENEVVGGGGAAAWEAALERQLREDGTGGIQTNEAEESSFGVGDRKSCRFCGRKFATDRLSKHENVCTSAPGKKRKVFDSSKVRTEGTGAEKFTPKSRGAGRRAKGRGGAASRAVGAGAGAAKSKKSNKWREEHNQLVQAIRAARQMSDAEARGEEPPMIDVPSVKQDMVQCPHCGRSFNENAADRHIPKCKDMVHRPKTLVRKTQPGMGLGRRR